VYGKAELFIEGPETPIHVELAVHPVRGALASLDHTPHEI
jgi:hypothetical protein